LNGSKNQAVLFYYFDYTNQANQTLENFGGSLLKQLLCTANYIPQEVQTLYADYGKGSDAPDFTTLFRLLHPSSTQFSTIYLVLDALDEQEERKRKKLVSFLGELKRIKEARWKILCTTRNHLRALADNLKGSAIFEIEANNPDVKAYVEWRLDEEWQHHEDLKSVVVEAVMRQDVVTYAPAS
jgi:hypothetical protein